MKKRLDTVLVKEGFALSRERARSLIMGNRVLVDGIPVSKAGHEVKEFSRIFIKKGSETPFVGRGGLKLDFAINKFHVPVNGKIAMDVGASTGGFTDCLLQKEAKKVYAVDVGYGQLAWKLRNDARVIPVERTNIRYLHKNKIPDTIDIAVIDVSFISLKKVIPKVLEFLSPHGEIVSLVKPQFEVGKGEVGKGGIVGDQTLRQKVVEEIKKFMIRCGLRILGDCESPVKGQKGNREYFLYVGR